MARRLLVFKRVKPNNRKGGPQVKVICGLGNPGGEYEATRHNVGWWALDLAQKGWGLHAFKRDGNARTTTGRVAGEAVKLIKPLTYMNLSGRAIGHLLRDDSFDPARDLLVVVDDTAIDVGRLRFRERGSSGGHNGLKSIEATLRTQEYARLRIGVGAPPPDMDLADWVLSPFDKHDRETVTAMIPDVVDAMKVWIEEGGVAVGNRFNK
jgi:PTH1 family peptidyl-tRNA hydrolase